MMPLVYERRITEWGTNPVRERLTLKLCISLLGMESWFADDFAAVRDVVVLADKLGIDQVSVVDHVVMGMNHEQYPYGAFRGSVTSPFLEPLVQLATYAAVTNRIRLSSGIVIAPLRAAALLAKQLATLDVLSHGRVDIGLGVGWQSEEYGACGVDWDQRFAILEEQIRVCRALWSEADVTFQGEHVQFSNVTAMPLPPQGRNIPIWLGVALKRRNVERIAELCDGWIPMERDLGELRQGVDRLKAAFEAHGRDPDSLDVRATYEIVRGADGKPDIAATLARTRDYAAAGVTMLRLEPRVLCRRLEDVQPLLERALEAAALEQA